MKSFCHKGLAVVVVLEMVVDPQKLLLKRLANFVFVCSDVFLSSLVATCSIECMLSSCRLHTSAFPFSLTKDAMSLRCRSKLESTNSNTHCERLCT